MDRDLPYAHVINLMRLLERQDAYNPSLIYIVTGRPESHRKVTLDWLFRYQVPCDYLLMRTTGDHTPDREVKRGMLHLLQKGGLKVLFAVDDRPSVCQMWRDEGVPCFACDHANWRQDPKEMAWLIGKELVDGLRD